MESIIQDLLGKQLNSIVSCSQYHRIRCERNSKWNFFFPKKKSSSVAYAELFSEFILQILKRQEIITVSGAWCWENNFRHQSTYIFLVYLKNPTSKRYCLLHYWAIFLWIACMLIITNWGWSIFPFKENSTRRQKMSKWNKQTRPLWTSFIAVL